MIYNELYDLIITYCFGGQVLANSNAELVAMLIATSGTVFVVALPFLLVWKVIKMIGG